MRNNDRHSHICIRLQVRSHDKWQYIEALQWNAEGFNFYHADTVPGPSLELRRGLTRFGGTIVWQTVNTSDEVVVAMVVNRLLYTRAKDVANQPQLHARLVKLMRVPGLVAEKLKVLASLGLTVSDAHMAQLVAQHKLQSPGFHYGVKVQSEDWAGVVDSALSVSSVLVSLDKWSGALGGKP